MLNNESDETQESQRVQAQALHKTGFQESIKISNIETTRDVPDEASVSNLNSQLPQRGTPRELEETLVQDARPATPNLTTVLEKSENETKEETMQNTSDCATEKDRASGETALSPIDDKEETGERSGSFEETLQTSLAAANSRYNQVEPMWKPDPPPLPPLRDFDDDNEEDWLS